MTTKPPFTGLRYCERPGIIVGPDRFSPSIGAAPGHTLMLARMEPPHLTFGFIDDDDRHSLGRMMAAAPAMLATLMTVRLVMQDERERRGASDAQYDFAMEPTLALIDAALAIAEGRS